MLLIALAWPGSGRTGQQLWILALGFAGYNLVVELVRRTSPRLRTYAWVPFFDLPVVGVLCSFGAEAGGPLFVGQSEPDLPEALRDHLLRFGYIKIDGKGWIDEDRYGTGDLIARVGTDTVTLTVGKDRVLSDEV